MASSIEMIQYMFDITLLWIKQMLVKIQVKLNLYEFKLNLYLVWVNTNQIWVKYFNANATSVRIIVAALCNSVCIYQNLSFLTSNHVLVSR